MMVVKLGCTGESKPLFYNYLRPLTSLDEGLYALACEEDVRCLATLVRNFKLIEVYIEYDVTALDSYIRPPCKPTKEPVCDSITPSSLPQHDSSTPYKDFVCESITPRCMPDCMLTPLSDESVITYIKLSGVQEVDTQEHVLPTIQSQFSDINLSFVSQQADASQVIDDVIRQLSFEDTELDGEAGFADVARSGVESSGLSHDEYFGVDDLDLNLNEPVDLNVSQIETQSELLVSEEPDFVRCQEPIMAEVRTQELVVEEVRTQEPIVEDVIVEDYVSSEEDAEQCNGQDDESAPSDRQFFYDDEGIDTAFETEYDVQSSEDAGTYDDDDENFLVDKENEIVEPDADVHLFGINMDVPFDNIGATNLVSDDVLEGEDIINADGFDSDPDEDDEISNYKRRSRRNLKLYKNDSIRIRARCDGKVPVFTMSQGIAPTSPNYGMEAGPSGSSGPSTRSRKRKNTGTNDDNQACSSVLDAHDKGDLYPLGLRSASATSVKEFEKYMLEFKKMNLKARRAKSDLFLNNICEVFNGKIVGGRDKLVIILLEYIREYCMKRIVNIQSVIDKCTGPLTPTATRSIKWELTGIPCKHVVAACWNMALNDRAAPPLEAWVNPCYWLTTWKETYSHKVGRPKKKRKRSKHNDETFVKDGKLRKKGRTITCQSCGNIRHNKATCKGQVATGSASRQAQQINHAFGQDSTGGTGVGAVIGLSTTDGQGGIGGPGGMVQVLVLAVKVYPVLDDKEKSTNKKN
ncbi:hypothetical protein Tco_0381210 [Tanacetum coccineum]